MRLDTAVNDCTVSLLHQEASSCLVWSVGDQAEVVRLPAEVVLALMLLSVRGLSERDATTGHMAKCSVPRWQNWDEVSPEYRTSPDDCPVCAVLTAPSPV